MGNFIGVTIHESSYIDKDVQIGHGTTIWHFCHIIEQSIIGNDCSIGQNVVVGPKVKIGNRVKIQNNVSVYEGVTLEDDVFCGPSCVFTNVINPRSHIIRRDKIKPTLIRKGASIGANATIVCGNQVGTYAFVAAGSTVTADVPDFALVAGVPAKIVGWYSKEGGRLDDNLTCPISGMTYMFDQNGILKQVDNSRIPKKD